VTRSVRDTARLLDAVCGPAPGDRYYVDRPARPFAEELNADPGSLRVAVHTESFWGRATEPDVRAAVEQVARRLEELGHTVDEASCPVSAGAFRRAHLVWWPWLLAGVATALGSLVGREVSAETVEAASHACVSRGLELTATDVAVAGAIQNAAGRAWGGFLDDYDLFLCPTTPTGPPPSGTPAQNDPAYGTAEEWIDQLFDWIPYTPIANLTGQPSISLPLGMSSDGLPIGVMLTAQALREDVLIRVAAQLETAMPWADRAPPLAA
jgi:amidase